MHPAIKVFAPHKLIPGLQADSNREIVHQFRQIADAVDGVITAITVPVTELKTASGYVVQMGEVARVNPPAAGMSILLPPVTESNEGDECAICVTSVASGGSVTVSAINGALINGAATMTLTAVGLYVFQSLGATYEGWTTAPAGGGGGGEDWSTTLGIGATSGPHNPIIDAGQFMQFGAVGPATSSPQIRSGDAHLRIRATNLVSVGGGTGALFFSSAGVTELGADGGTLTLSTSTIARVSISSTGEWIAPAGSSGQVWTHQGAGTPPIWAPASGGGTDPRIFAWFGV